MTTLVWFRQDLRLTDNPALEAASALGAAVPLYVHAPAEEAGAAPGAASRWWLHQSLAALDTELAEAGSRLTLRLADNSLAAILDVAKQCGAVRVVWNRRYEPAARARDERLAVALRAQGIEVATYNSALLHEPCAISTRSGGPFQVFGAFWRHCKSLPEPAEGSARPAAIGPPLHWPRSQALAQLCLLPQKQWAHGLAAHWTPGSRGADAALARFLDRALEDYDSARDRPDQPGTSRLSPHLHFGEIGPRQVWHAARRRALGRGRHSTWREAQFLTEIGWREFAYHLLYHFPHTPEQPLRQQFAHFPWKNSPSNLRAWQRGMTGYPVVDAGMRQLWRTGWMHNRVRMIAGSFLVKDLLLPWTQGAEWFWDTLIDADLASNTLGWQWVAGCGADAAPYFRVFNPTLQARRFDPLGNYVRAWVPELAQLPSQWIHEPWLAPAKILAAAGVQLGTSYPKPLVDHAEARAAALTAFAALKQ